MSIIVVFPMLLLIADAILKSESRRKLAFPGKKCHQKIEIAEWIWNVFFPYFSSSQFLMTPVYPKYYAGGRNCKWILRAEAGQRVQLRFLDISLREEVSQSSHPQCTDSIRVTERGRNLLSMCGESKQDIVLLSDANKLEVSVPILYHPRILTLVVNLESQFCKFCNPKLLFCWRFAWKLKVVVYFPDVVFWRNFGRSAVPPCVNQPRVTSIFVITLMPLMHVTRVMFSRTAWNVAKLWGAIHSGANGMTQWSIVFLSNTWGE